MTKDSAKKTARRREIREAAAELFATKGFHGTSMEEVAERAGILKGSLYYWIDSKDQLLADILESSILETVAEGRTIAADPSATPSEQLRRFTDFYIREWIAHPFNFNVAVSEYRWLSESALLRYRAEQDELESILRDIVNSGIASGEFWVDPQDVHMVASSIFGILNWFPRWYRSDGWASLNYVRDLISGLVLGGLRGMGRSRADDDGTHPREVAVDGRER